MTDDAILDAIGHTPLVPLRHVVPPGCGRVLVKLESQNPTGSMKDRMAPALAARLGPGATVATLACDTGLKYLSTDLYATTS